MGELKKVRSEKFNHLVYYWPKSELNLGELCKRGTQLKTHVVWFGEEVPMMTKALKIAASAKILIVVGTSLNVYPAANVAFSVPVECKNYLVDPNPPTLDDEINFTVVKAGAEEGILLLVKKLCA